MFNDYMFQILTTALVFIVILTVLVLIHELGHLLAALFFGVKVEEFGFGLPPRIWGKEFGGIMYSLNWIPVGGFVKLFGEDNEESKTGTVTIASTRSGNVLGAIIESRAFYKKPKKQRAVILSAGVFMNFLLAVGITTFLLVHGVKEPAPRVHVETVMAGTPAEAAGFKVGDVLTDLSVSSPTHQVFALHQPTQTNDVIQFTRTHAGSAIAIVVQRGGSAYHLSIVPRENPPKGQGPMGIAISNLEVHKYPLSQAPGKALSVTFSRAADMLGSLGTTIARLATLHAPQADVAGPIGIAQVTGQAVKFGWEAVLEFASILSLNLAVLNILPIPALDGGRLAFVFLEKIFRKRVNPVWERNAHQIGMVILLILIVLVSINDIIRLAHGG